MEISIKNGTLTQIQEALSPAAGYALPNSITVTGAASSYSSSSGLVELSSPTSTVVLTATGEVAIRPITIGDSIISKCFVGSSEVSKIYLGTQLIFKKTSN